MMAMSYNEYVSKYGMGNEGQEGWSEMTDRQKEMYKQNVPTYEGPSGTEQQMAGDIWSQIQAGPDTNIWRGLSEVFGFKPGAIKQFAMGKFQELMQTPDFAKEYGLGRKALDQQLMEAERSLAGKFAARGLLDSSAHAAAVGGAMGGYTQGLANLMLGKAGMEESARQSRFGQAMGMAGTGLSFADSLNAQWLQGIGLQGEALNYLNQQRGQRNQFNLANQGFQWNPTTGADIIPGMVGIGLQAAGMANPFSFDWGGGGANMGANQPNFMQDYINQQNTAGNYMADYLNQ